MTTRVPYLSRIQAGFIMLLFFIYLFNPVFSQNKIAQGNWPQFRGVQASGVADAQNVPVEWDAETGYNIKWKVRIPGLGLSSPVIWGNRVFVTTVVGEGHEDEEPFLKVGLFGESPENPEDYPHLYQVYCLDKESGKVLWKKIAHRGVPQVMRHVKGSHANSSVATDGEYVVAFFGSEGLYCFDMNGNLKWKKDLGYLDAGAFDAPSIQWGFGSSPIIYKGRVVTLCDVNNQSFIASFDVKTGREIWRSNRDEVPTWGTPTAVDVNGRDMIIVNGWKHRGGYDFETGEAVWWMNGGGDIPAPTPVIAHGMAFFSSSHGRLRPIYAISLEAKGDVSLNRGETSNQYVAWSYPRRGAYMSTPIVVGDYLYVGDDRGVLTCYDAKTGEEIYRERIAGKRGAYTASPVAANGNIYFVEEYGNIHVVKAGPEYVHLASNAMGEPILASPAISGRMMFIRTSRTLYGIEDMGKGKKPEKEKTKIAETRPKPEMPELPEHELKDAVEILQTTDAVCRTIQSIRYSISMEGAGALAERMPKAKALVTESGWADFFPEKFMVSLDVTMNDMSEPDRVMGGSDGNKYYLIDPASKTVHSDFEFGVFGRFAQAVYGGLVAEFLIDGPFDSEIECPDKTLKGIVEIEGEPCYEIVIRYANERNTETTWWISTRDYMPRKRTDIGDVENGERGGRTYTLTEVVVEPQLTSSFFVLEVPEGFTETNQAAR